MHLRAACKTTAMGIMPHTDIERAIKLALSLDIPFFPQLPHVSFYEDMYAQTSQNFPGIIINPGDGTIGFNSAKFERELSDYSRKMADPETFALTPEYSVAYRHFLRQDLHGFPAIRGQITGPVSFGFRVTDENLRPIIYNDEVRPLLFDFIQRKANLQYQQLKEKNDHAFVWLDEPGLGWVFSGLSGYSDIQAKQDYQSLLAGFEGPKALHLCANVNLPYLLKLGLDILSFDAYQIELMPKGYAGAVAEFIQGGGIISWGIVPTDSVNLGKESPETLAALVLRYWDTVSANAGVTSQQIAEQALIAPARCCLKNIGQVGSSEDATCSPGVNLSVEEGLVEKALCYLKKLSTILQNHFQLQSDTEDPKML